METCKPQDETSTGSTLVLHAWGFDIFAHRFLLRECSPHSGLVFVRFYVPRHALYD